MGGSVETARGISRRASPGQRRLFLANPVENSGRHDCKSISFIIKALHVQGNGSPRPFRLYFTKGDWTAAYPRGRMWLSAVPPTLRSVMKRLVPIPSGLADHLKHAGETGIGYQVVSVELRDGRSYDQVVTSEGCIIEVRGFKEIPFAADEVASVNVNHKRWNFRGGSGVRGKARAATA